MQAFKPKPTTSPNFGGLLATIREGCRTYQFDVTIELDWYSHGVVEASEAPSRRSSFEVMIQY